MLTPERARTLAGGALGTALGYLAFRRSAPWTVREALVVLGGIGMVVALAIAVSVRGER